MNQWFAQNGIDVTKPLAAKHCKESFDYKISAPNGYEDAFNTWLDENPNVILTQQEYDALMIHRWQSGRLDRLNENDPNYLDTSVLSLLKNQNRNRTDWQTVFNNRRKDSSYYNELKQRTEWELDIFFNGGYEGSNMWFEPLNTVYDNL